MKTLVIGASPNPMRYAYKAVRALREHDIEVVAIGKRETTIEDVQVVTDKPRIDGLHTVTLYVGPQNQGSYVNYILSLKPKRIIFNPGTYNEDLITKAEQSGIACIKDCTLVMLATDSY